MSEASEVSSLRKDTLRAQATDDREYSLQFVRSMPMGEAYLLCSFWEQLGIHKVLEDCLKKKSFTSPTEWAVFAMAAISA